MQKMATTTQTGMRPDETGIKSKTKEQNKTLHHGNLETLRRYRTISISEDNIPCLCVKWFIYQYGCLQNYDTGRKNKKERTKRNFYRTYQHGTHNKYVMSGRSYSKTMMWFDKIKNYETVPVHATNTTNLCLMKHLNWIRYMVKNAQYLQGAESSASARLQPCSCRASTSASQPVLARTVQPVTPL